MYTASYFIDKLEMMPHIEGGYYKECFVSDIGAWSSIYFLLEQGEVSHFHRLQSDELWYYHAGSALTIYMIDARGELIEQQLGLDIAKGEMPQVLVPRGSIFGSAQNEEGFSLVGCMVAPGFTFEGFELFEREELMQKYPEYQEVIMKLTR
ncbi:cupin domain-containing protein [Cellulosilyticum sp. I15G10I2]|uniref:cupin domain-containing protein n=1 Tax=Cellulosilyticum sp. I15G10I2 TaxID=1892843 RepID=UPI00085C268F|nr:cupin domain-containing protein [Cellulosilyticum sp. I15G10I2]